MHSKAITRLFLTKISTIALVLLNLNSTLAADLGPYFSSSNARYYQQNQSTSVISRSHQMIPPSINSQYNPQRLHLQLKQQTSPQVNLNQQQNVYTKSMQDTLLDLRQSMLTKSTKFDECFRNLLTLSKRDLHQMFTKTYGLLYEQNTEIFTEMFASLEQYYEVGRVKLGIAMESFFERLYQKIFQALNSSYDFSQEYLKCATEQMNFLKPFGDVPDKLIKEIKESLVAARTFVQALSTGIDVIKEIVKLGHPSQCTNLIQDKLLNPKLSVIGQLSATNATIPNQQLSPCQSYCELVILRCFGKYNLDALQINWKQYVSALTELSSKLSANYNIAIAIEPLDIRVSEAIMNFQDNGTIITEKVFKACKPIDDKPKTLLSSRTSAVDLQFSDSSSKHIKREVKFNGYHSSRIVPESQILPIVSNIGLKNQVLNARPLIESEVPYDTRAVAQELPVSLDDIKKYMNGMKSFWHNLPTAVCSNKLTSQFVPANSRKPSCFEDKLTAHDNNVDMGYRIEINNQVNKLLLITAKINQALKGQETDLTGDFPSLPSSTNRPLPTTTTEEPSFGFDESITDEQGSGIGDELPDDESADDNEDDYDVGSSSEPSADISPEVIGATENESFKDPDKIDDMTSDLMNNNINNDQQIQLANPNDMLARQSSSGQLNYHIQVASLHNIMLFLFIISFYTFLL